MTPLETYKQRVVDGELSIDPAQELAAQALQRCYEDLLLAGAPSRSWYRKLTRIIRNRPPPPKGVYLWGGVGRGKTLLMDMFFNSLPFEDKRRQHFHRFMSSIHENLKLFKHRKNPLKFAADHFANSARVICFDEFAVTDIADAMILSNLFEALFDRGVTLIATSNSNPDDLYYNGLQRQRFMSAINLIKKNTESVHVKGVLDYRLRILERADVYQQPANHAAERELTAYFAGIAPDQGRNDTHISILGRNIECRKEADGVIWFDFQKICDGPRSQDDYIELSRCYQTVIVSNVPQFTKTMENQARRFISLVDEFYDRRVKLILSAAVPIASLYVGERVKLEFNRTRSRLEEMQSHDYLAAPHLP